MQYMTWQELFPAAQDRHKPKHLECEIFIRRLHEHSCNILRTPEPQLRDKTCQKPDARSGARPLHEEDTSHVVRITQARKATTLRDHRHTTKIAERRNAKQRDKQSRQRHEETTRLEPPLNNYSHKRRKSTST